MKRMILFFMMVISVHSIAQDTTFTDRQKYIDYIYDGIPDQFIPTGYLLDRIPFIEDTYERFENRGILVEDTLDGNDWIAFYKFLEMGWTERNEMPPIDSLTWPVFDQLLLNQSSSVSRYPLMVMDFYMNRIKDDAIQNGHILLQDDRYSVGDDPKKGIDTRRLGVTSILADTVVDDLIIYIDPDYILTNRGKPIVFSELKVNGATYDLRQGDEVNLMYDLRSGENVLTATHFFGIGDSVVHRFKVYKKEHSQLRSSGDFDETGTISGEGINLEYAVVFGSGNMELTKPVYFVSGFGPAAANRFLNDHIRTTFDDLYQKYNLSGLMNELYASGHDIVLVKFNRAVARIEDEGDLLIELIDNFNDRKFENESFIENVIVGYSAGALVSKFALDKMEHEHLNFGGNHHNTRLYISFEGEHLGANVPLGLQHATQHMKVNNGSLSTNVVHYLANSPMAKQLLYYFHTSTGGHGYLPYENGQGGRLERLQLRKAFEEIYVSDKQIEKYGYHGYPAFTRNVTISNGSRKSDGYTAFLAPDEYPFSIHAVMPIFYQNNLLREWTVNWDFNSNFNSSGSTAPWVVFRYREGIGKKVKYLEEFRTNTDILVMDMTAGGFAFGEEDLPLRVLKKMAGFCFDGCLSGSPDIYEYRLNCFTPLFSSVGIKNPALYVKNHYADVDLHELDLMRFAFGTTDQGDFGYPVLAHPEDHFLITPFEAIYCSEYNETHITSKRVSGNPDEVGSLVLEPVASSAEAFRDFIMSEVQADLLYLQNRRIGWNTSPDEVYQVDFVAERIEIGERVWPGTDVALFEVWENGVVRCEGGESVHIVEGFHVEVGGVFHGVLDQ